MEEQCQRIAVGLHGGDADVGADPRQQHVARDQHGTLGRVERRVLGRMTETLDHAPRRSAGAARAAFLQAHERFGELRDASPGAGGAGTGYSSVAGSAAFIDRTWGKASARCEARRSGAGTSAWGERSFVQRSIVVDAAE